MALFTRFQKNYEKLLPHSSDQPLSRFDITSFNATAQSLLRDCRENVLKLAQSELLLRRDDYLEFVHVCTVFLDTIDGHETEKTFTFRRPGALHQARWMAKLLYSIKMCLFEQQIMQLPPGTIATRQQVTKVKDFVIFASHVYSTWWMTCNSAVDAPVNDLKLYHLLLQYEVVN